jgi:hypothetical protein
MLFEIVSLVGDNFVAPKGQKIHLNALKFKQNKQIERLVDGIEISFKEMTQKPNLRYTRYNFN